MFRYLKQIAVSSFLIAALSTQVSAQSDAFCKTATENGASLMEINMAALKTIDNMLPIRIGSTELGSVDELGDRLGSASDDGASGEFICECKMPPPIFLRVGISISFWNPMGTINTSTIPYCMPNLGVALPVNGVGADMSYGKRSGTLKDQQVSAQTHYYSSLNILNVISDTLTKGCIQVSMQTGVDHISELLPWWQNDTWAAVFSPESLLIANPIAAMACVADALTVLTAKKSINPLFWCYGSWGSSYPVTVNVGSGTPLTSYALLAARTLADQFKMLKIMKTSGKHMLTGVCQPYPTVFIVKNDLKMYPIYPHLYDSGFPIGYPSEIWGVGMDNPANMGVMTWMVYQKRDCCYL